MQACMVIKFEVAPSIWRITKAIKSIENIYFSQDCDQEKPRLYQSVSN